MLVILAGDGGATGQNRKDGEKRDASFHPAPHLAWEFNREAN